MRHRCGRYTLRRGRFCLIRRGMRANTDRKRREEARACAVGCYPTHMPDARNNEVSPNGTLLSANGLDKRRPPQGDILPGAVVLTSRSKGCQKERSCTHMRTIATCSSPRSTCRDCPGSHRCPSNLPLMKTHVNNKAINLSDLSRESVWVDRSTSLAARASPPETCLVAPLHPSVPLL